jgi:Ca2+-binding RTX toxin-like protein
MPDRRLLGAAIVVAAMLIAPASALAGKPVRVTTCVVSTDVTTTSIKSKGSVTLTITGTTGADTIDCSGLTKGGVVINGRGGGDIITGTPFADSINDGAIGPGPSATVFGLGGNDIIRVGWGDVTSYASASVDAGPGDDQVVANGGFVGANGGDGNDLLDLSAAYAATADGGPGNDTVTGPSAPVDENLCSCVNELAGGAGDDVITGGAGHDELSGGPGLDQMHAGPGIDSITDYGTGAELFDCGDGADIADDFDGNGVATDGTIGYANASEDDTHPNCEEVRVAVSAP